MRQPVLFQVTNRTHRAYFKQFLQIGSWKDCPVQFVLPSNSMYVNVPDYIRDQLLDYYMQKDSALKINYEKTQSTQTT